MFLEQSQELLLEGHCAMMALLRSNILNSLLQQRKADAEGAVLHLPTKHSVFGKGIMHPFAGAAFDELHRLGKGNRRGQ